MEKPTKEQVAAFEKEYNELCKKHSMILNFIPQWKQSQDTGMWSMVLVPMVAVLPPEPKE
jgi:hypothetical protein